MEELCAGIPRGIPGRNVLFRMHDKVPIATNTYHYWLVCPLFLKIPDCSLDEPHLLHSHPAVVWVEIQSPRQLTTQAT